MHNGISTKVERVVEKAQETDNILWILEWSKWLDSHLADRGEGGTVDRVQTVRAFVWEGLPTDVDVFGEDNANALRKNKKVK